MIAEQLPNPLNVISVKDLINTDERNAFMLCLGNEKSVKGITVVKMKRCYHDDVLKRDIQCAKGVHVQLL